MTECPSLLSFCKKQFFPFAIQGMLKAEECSNENIDISRLDFLDGSNIKIGQFRQFFLGHAYAYSFSSHIGSKLL